VPSDVAPEPPTDFDGYLQRASLLADLGRYDEAAAELGFAVALDPASLPALTMLARIHLAADRPGDALTVVDTALIMVDTALIMVDTASDTMAGDADLDLRVPIQVVRGLALVDLRRFDEAAQLAIELMERWVGSAYAQRSAAAILASARNGQRSLDAAWRGAELAPEEAQAHLVLGLVAARLELFDLAERAYREALRLDPLIGEAQHDIGVVNLEQRRYAAELAMLAELAAARTAQRPEPGAQRIRTVGSELRRLVFFGAGYSIVAAVLVAFLATGNGTASRSWAVFCALGGALLVWVLARRVPGKLTELLPELMGSDRPLALGVYAVAAAPCLILLYAVTGNLWLLVLAIVATAAAQVLAMRQPARPPD